MSAPALAMKPIDRDWLDGFLVRWKLSDDYFNTPCSAALSAEQTVRRLLRQDVPFLVQELLRLRPELR